MGGTKDFKAKGVFKYKAETVIDGIKVLVGNTEPKRNLPKFAGKSLFYAKAVDGKIQQIMVYRNGVQAFRIETGHEHVNKVTHERFGKEDIHVQNFVDNPKTNGRDSTHKPKTKLEKSLAKLIGRTVR